jgi:ubiquinone biosynthesis protein
MELTSRSLLLGRRIKHMGRLAHIVNVFARHGLWSIAERLGVQSWLTPEQVRRAEELSREGGGAEGQGEIFEVMGMPARIRRSFEELGPAFVKLGQVLAVREDLLSKEYIDELCKLHFNVGALPFNAIKQILKEELGEERLKQFASIEEAPLAAGSIAQVHRAVLVTGEKVVVKVQRPGIEQQIKVDLSLMEEVAGLLEKFIPETRIARPMAMVNEFRRAIIAELDFVREAGNLAKIARNFASWPDIVVPAVHWKLSSVRVITQTLLEGLPAWDRDRIVTGGLRPEVLVERGLGMFLKMVFVDGLFHGDLHPGNLLAMRDDKVGVLDFGLVVHLSKSTREHLAGLLISLIDEDFHRVVSHYIELADPAVDFNAETFEHEVGNVVAPFIGLSLEDVRTGRLFWDLARVAATHGAPMPQELIVFIKTLVSFEGIGKNLDPGFDVLSAADKYTSEIASELYSPENLKQQALLIARDVTALAKHGPYLVRRLLRAALEGDLNMTVKSEELKQLAVSVDRSSSRLSISMIIASLIIGSSILTFSGKGQELSTMPVVGLAGFALAGVLGFYIVWSVLRGGRM